MCGIMGLAESCPEPGAPGFVIERGVMRRIDPLDEARAHAQATLAHCVAEHDWFGYHATLAYYRTLMPAEAFAN